MEEEEHYAQKTSQIREFYQNRPPTTVSFNLYLYSMFFGYYLDQELDPLYFSLLGDN